ncbi:MAG: NAD kinase [Muribaculaceae bacterium]|nr:NAD kinase [Muribaculaceae bacterium]
MRIAIYGNNYQDDHIDDLCALFGALSTCDVSIGMEWSFYNYMCRVLPIAPKVDRLIQGGDFDADLVLSIGGDGTFLRAAQWVGNKEIPILGINTGHLGYMADVTTDDIESALDDLFNGNYRIERRTMIEVDVPGMLIDLWPYALNEVAIQKQDTSSMISVEAYINGDYLATYTSDGLIVSTPTGSTGYNLSVGGPIVEPSTPGWVVSPIAAHSLTMRPLVVSDSSRIEIVTRSRAQAYRLSLDGRSLTLPVGTKVVLCRAPFVTRVVKRKGVNFTDTLRGKLLWGVDKR